MSKKIEALRGMEDILPGEVEKWQWVEEKARLFFQGFGFKEIRTPVLEYTELFSRSVGEGSDIVRKEMFSFEDRGERNVTLRPEMTASVARAVIEKGLLSQAKSLRFYYIGPMFRAERPQAGRKRQFHQIGIEIINEEGVIPDVAAVYYLYRFLKELGVNDLEIRVNDLGSLEEQKRTSEKLREYFSGHQASLCEDCRDRLGKNVLRILDCKNPKCLPVIEKAPWEEIAPLGENFNAALKALKEMDPDIPLQTKRRLVRGLDYYNGLVFEVAAKGLGAQDALAGGGRYDRLYSDLGGKPTPCIGFSIGMERILMALGETAEKKCRENLVYFAPGLTPEEYGKGGLELLNKTVRELSRLGLKPVLGDSRLKMGDHFKYANKIGAKYTVVLGSDEFQKKSWTVKNMDEQKQDSVAQGDLFFHLKGKNFV